MLLRNTEITRSQTEFVYKRVRWEEILNFRKQFVCLVRLISPLSLFGLFDIVKCETFIHASKSKTSLCRKYRE